MIWDELFYARGLRDEGDVDFTITAPSSGIVTIHSVARQTVTAASGGRQTVTASSTAKSTVTVGGAL